MRISLIIPAYNEEKMIAQVLVIVEKALRMGVIQEALVVDDGSVDRTKEVAEGMGFNVLRSERNLGKAGAMILGAKNTTGDLLLFWDADLVGTKIRHFRQLIDAIVSDNGAKMAIGRLVGKDIITFVGQSLTPQLSGQRIISRQVFEDIMEIQGLDKSGFAIELVIIKFFRNKKIYYKYVNLENIKIIPKEQKEGLKGFRDRLIMYRELLTYFKIDIDKRRVRKHVFSHANENK